jgi:hypothetical protein
MMLAHRPSRSLAVRRALRRRKEAGAALFVVAVTLALLATMGVYGLSSTALDVRSAGHNREAMAGQNIAEHTFIVTNDAFSPDQAQGIINGMYGAARTTNCKTAAKWTGSTDNKNNAEACTRLNAARLQALAIHNPGPAFGNGDGFLYQTLSLGHDQAGNPLPIEPDVQVEITNPVAVSMPGFESADSGQKQFAQLTVTVFTEMKEAGKPPAMAVAGRGRIIVGPVSLDQWQ